MIGPITTSASRPIRNTSAASWRAIHSPMISSSASMLSRRAAAVAKRGSSRNVPPPMSASSRATTGAVAAESVTSLLSWVRKMLPMLTLSGSWLER